MSLTSNGYGLRPIGDQSGTGRTVRMPLGIVSGYASNIFKYQPVTINPANGTLIAVTNPGNTPQKPFGVFAGVEYTPLGGRPAVSPFWPAGTVYDSTYDMLVYFWPMWIPGLRWQIQADGSVAQTLMGSQFVFTNLGVGSTYTGLSGCTVGAAGVVAASQGQMALSEFATDNTVTVGSAAGDAFTDLIMEAAYSQIGPGSQTSIG